MPEKVLPGPVQPEHCIKEAVCVHTKRVYDSCKDKDCLEDLRVYLTRGSQCIIDKAINAKCHSAELLWVYIDVEAVPFNQGFYTVDAKYFYRIKADAFCGVGRPQRVTGLATFDKRVILFGSEGNVKIFSSKADLGDLDPQMMRTSNLPNAVVEAVDPICLDVKLVETCSGHCPPCGELSEVPDCICRCFDDELVLSGDQKRMYCTLGQFSIIKLERDSQLLLPAYDFCMPDKECIGGNENDPCELFAKIKFPVDEFFPPAACDFNDDRLSYRGCRD